MYFFVGRALLAQRCRTEVASGIRAACEQMLMICRPHDAMMGLAVAGYMQVSDPYRAGHHTWPRGGHVWTRT